LEGHELSLLLTDRYLNVKSEDEVIDALITWLYANIDTVDDRTLIEEVMRNVNWTFVSIEKILELYRIF
jgi:hypothetical protein